MLPGLGSRPDPAHSARVKALVLELVHHDEITVLVTQLERTEPGCPPVETVIALLGADRPVQYRIHKPVADVNADDVRVALGTGDHAN
jgi:hypothetical protein